MPGVQTCALPIRSEEHTSELQSHDNLECRLLLEKSGDGNPTYMLAVVFDDYHMGVTHVNRGADLLINAARQKQIYDALGFFFKSPAPTEFIPFPHRSPLPN